MNNRLRELICSLLIWFAFYGIVTAAPQIQTSDFRIIEPPAVAPHAAAYDTITNIGSAEDVLVAVRSQVSQFTELHQSIVHSGAAHMRKIDNLLLESGQFLILKPQSYHIMFKRLIEPLKHGDTIHLILVFKKSGEVIVEVPVIK